MNKKLTSLLLLLPFTLMSQQRETLPYGDMNHWVTRVIKESRLLGGDTKECYAIGPSRTVQGDRPYVNMGGSPWASSNVLAKPAGVVKVSNAVFPDTRSGADKCAKMCTMMEHCKALGLINIDVMVAGTIFLGRMHEPITSTSNPYSKMEVGIPFAKRPVAMVFDYKLLIPANGKKVYSSGFGKQRVYAGTDRAEAFVILQRRWEDADGNIYAKRVGTARESFGSTTSGWQNDHKMKIVYGDATQKAGYNSRMGLIPKAKSYYARNSKGQMKPVLETGWDDDDATPTHLIVMFSSGSGEPYTGTPGTTFWVDNVAMAY